MKRFLSLLLSALMILVALASCGGQTPAGPASSENSESRSEEPGTGTEPESETEQASAEEPVTSKYETEYVAPADGSFTICGIPLSEYSLVMYFPGSDDFRRMDRKKIVESLTAPFNAATGTDTPVRLVKNERFDDTPSAEHEILFGSNFRREGMPEYRQDNYYGVTADGTVYFCAITPVLFGYLWEQFLEEFFGVAPGSGDPSKGCAIGECYRELPRLTYETLEARGYSIVLDETFDDDTLDTDIWRFRGNGARRNGFVTPSQISLSDGILSLTGEYLTDGEYGEGWYGAMIGLKQWYCRGYFEASIKCSETLHRGKGDFWSAFWIQGPHPYEPELSLGGSGEGGAEIDILEYWDPNSATCNVWVSGYNGNEDLDSDHCEVNHLYTDYTEAFHTYSLLWDENFYEFFIDGILVFHTNFGTGTSPAEEEVILSLELPDTIDLDPAVKRVMEVDFLRVWQKQ
ncbi:MAG: family 16 glycosylhydrolase [Candidatus Methanomethylophilaceae archaeon]|nr:family 16 glycosylhydrolase [Candidatus Methanomethylophilaceae archaeon]